eukprot:71796_1
MKLVITLARITSLLAGVMMVCVGLLHVGVRLSKPYCSGGDEETCIGPALIWSDTQWISDSNGEFRSIFMFVPKRLIDLWTPLVVGLLTVNFQLSRRVAKPISRTWIRMAMWFIIAALNGCLGYAGNIGLVTGFFSVFTSLVCLVAFFIDRESSTSLELKLPFMDDDSE